MVDLETNKIIATAHDVGRCHDFKLSQKSRTILHPDIESFVDSGYQGWQNLHALTQMPYKKNRKRKLDKEEKEYNRAVSRVRIVAEHTIRRLKVFRILKHEYRNRRKRFALRCNLVAAICNLELNS